MLVFFGMQMDEEPCQNQWKLPEINACPCKQGNACDRKTFTTFYRMRYIISCPCKRSLCLLSMQMDEQLSFKEHIARKSRAAACALFNLMKLRRYFNKRKLFTICECISFFAHMDYGNALFINMPESTIKPFQKIQILTAKIILEGKKLIELRH